MRVVLGADHRGVSFKEILKKRLSSGSHECIDIGSQGEAKVDYPDYAFRAAEMVASGEADVGILICGTGIGMCMAANKVRGVRAALCLSERAAELARRHNNANVLTLGGWQAGEDEVFRIVDRFLDTSFEGGRHARRVAKIDTYEKER